MGSEGDFKSRMYLTILFSSSLFEFLAKLPFIAQGVLGLGFVIFVHELGHFLVAKLCGVKCEKFYVGFDVPIKIGPIQLPRTLFRKKIGETEYGLGIIPLGGYVKMLGQDDNPANAAKEAERIRVAREKAGPDGDIDEIQVDPRSYPAKSVPQRLAIISAGVVMNLIFAVIFGAVAYRMGVKYTPCVIGSTTPGLSGWEVGLQPGDRVLRVGEDGKKSENLRFVNDMIVQVFMADVGSKVDLLVKRYGQSEPETVKVDLRSVPGPNSDRPFIGIASIKTNTIGAVFDERFDQIASVRCTPPLEEGDTIVAIDGVDVDDHVQLTRILAKSIDKPLKLTVERENEESESTTQVDIQIDPNSRRWLGIGNRAGPIVSIQKNSPAELAGFQVGDKLKSIDGQPVDDAILIPHRLRRLADQSVEIVVSRSNKEGDAEDVTLVAQLREPTTIHTTPGMISNHVAAEALGIAFPVENVVASVAVGSPAEKAGIEVGDEITTVDFRASSDDNKELEGFTSKPFDLTEMSDAWPLVEYRMQLSLADTIAIVTYERHGKAETVEMTPTASSEWFVADRGFQFLPESEIHQVTGFKEAMALGLRETKESMQQVAEVLKRLFTGRISVTNLGGPITILSAAGSEAAVGVSRLLTFLTLLSANLAILNFLPIPVLDGGHVVFLLYEGIFRKPVDERVAFGLTMVGFCFVLSLMVFVIGLDIWRLVGFAG